MSGNQERNPLQAQAHRISHDLKNPLAAAREFISLLLDEVGGPITPQQREFLATSLECCDSVTDILDAWLLEIDNKS